MKKKITIGLVIATVLIIGYFLNPFRIIVVYPCSDYCSPEVVEKNRTEIYWGVRSERLCKFIHGKPVYGYGWSPWFVGCSPK